MDEAMEATEKSRTSACTNDKPAPISKKSSYLKPNSFNRSRETGKTNRLEELTLFSSRVCEVMSSMSVHETIDAGSTKGIVMIKSFRNAGISVALFALTVALPTASQAFSPEAQHPEAQQMCAGDASGCAARKFPNIPRIIA